MECESDLAVVRVNIDPDHDAIAIALEDQPPRLRDRVEFLASNLEELDMPQATFDIAILSSSL